MEDRSPFVGELREDALARWDVIRAEIIAGDRGDHQRMVFEDILDGYEERIAHVTAKVVRASQALHDLKNRLRDFEEVARRISANTGKSIEEARSIARRQDDEARRLGASVDAALDALANSLK